MKRINRSLAIILSVFFVWGSFTACEDFFNPDQDLEITEEKLFTDWYEYRSAMMGLYALQQQLVEQIVVLGELRADLLDITPNADPDLVEIYNFNVSKENKYASPANFFKLIAACNRLLSIIEHKRPQVLDKAATINNYDRLYGEVLTMRAWTYFYAARIYGKVPFIPQSLATAEEIESFVGSTGTYVDSIYITYSIDGYYNDTVYNKPVSLDKQYFDTERVIRYFANELETKVKAVGVNHYIENNDNSWEVTIWSSWGMNTLLGHMYLTLGDYAKSIEYFNKVVFNNSTNFRYQLDQSFSNGTWSDIYRNIDSREHIFSLWFNKANQQTHELQTLFEPFGPNKYMLKPTKIAVHKFETVWRGMDIRYDFERPDSTKTRSPGIPSDFFRGYGISYAYTRNNVLIPFTDFFKMLNHKILEEDRSVNSLMENVDTIVYKFSISKQPFDKDANFIIYRAGSVNLYMAEIYNYWNFKEGNVVGSFIQNALNIINNGSNYNPAVNRSQLGLRGRVALPPYVVRDINFNFDPFTNEVTGWYSLAGKLREKQYKLEDEIMDERIRELAFEGERFYDLMRVAKRRNDPSYLAQRVAAKFPEDRKAAIYNHLLNPENWYIPMFEE